MFQPRSIGSRFNHAIALPFDNSCIAQFCLLFLMVLVEATGVLLVMAAVDLGTLGRLVFLLGLALTAVPLIIVSATLLGGSLILFGVVAVVGKSSANSAYQVQSGKSSAFFF